jgi:tetratricopeptide (TPR) repeat protein
MLTKISSSSVYARNKYFHALWLAKQNPRHIVRWAKAQLNTANSELDKAWSYYVLGRALLRWEKIGEAKQALSTAESLFSSVDLFDSVLYCRYALLCCALEREPNKELVERFDELQSECEEHHLENLSTSIQLDKARTLLLIGKHKEGDSILHDLSQKRLRTFDYARLQRLKALGQASDRIMCCSESKQIFLEMKCWAEVAKCCIQLGWLLTDSEKLVEAVYEFEQAAKIIDRQGLPIQAALWAKNFGILTNKRGYFHLSVQVLLRALHEFAKIEHQKNIAGSLLNLGNVFFYTASWDKALLLYHHAVKSFEELKIKTEEQTALQNKALVYLERNQFDEAHNALSEAALRVSELQQEQNDISGYEYIWLIEAEIYTRQGNIAEAIEHYNIALDLSITQNNKLCELDCKMDLAELYFKQGKLTEAKNLFTSLVPEFNYYPHSLWRIYYGLAQCAQAEGEPKQALEYYKKSCANMAELRKRMSEKISSTLYLQATSMYTAALECAIELGEYEYVFELSELQRALVLTNQRIKQANASNSDATSFLDQLNKVDSSEFLDIILKHAEGISSKTELTTYVNELMQLSEEQDFSLQELRQSLKNSYDDNWTILNYFQQSTYKFYVGIITSTESRIEQIDLESLKIIYKDLRDTGLIGLLIKTIFQSEHADSQTNNHDITQFTQALLPQFVQDRLNPDHRLLIIPTGKLYNLPWAALRLKQQWLIEQAVIQLAPVLSFWTGTPPSRIDESSQLLLIGSEKFMNPELKELTEVKNEFGSIIKLWPKQRTIMNHEMTRSYLMQMSNPFNEDKLRNYKIIHFATHADAPTSANNTAYLHLYDGGLLLHEIASLDIHDAHILLSTCYGASSEQLNGDELLSLSWSFLAAGANTIIANLIKIQEIVVPKYIPLWYKAMRQHGDSALALAELQRTVIKEIQANPKMPQLVDVIEYWTHLICLGDSRITK